MASSIQRQTNAIVRNGGDLAKLQAIERQQLIEFATQKLEAQLIEGLSLTMVRAMQDIQTYARLAEENFDIVRRALSQDGQRIAELMVDAAEAALQKNTKRGGEPSRADDTGANQRFPGKLAPAIKRAIRPANDGVLVDFGVLDTEAKHWRRINSGAGDNAGQNPYEYPELFDPRPAFNIPMGFWSNSPAGSGTHYGFGEGSRQYFFPLGNRHGPSIPGHVTSFRTKGIEGKFFMEAAFDIAFEGFPYVLQTRVNQWKQSVISGRAPVLGEVL